MIQKYFKNYFKIKKLKTTIINPIKNMKGT